MPQRQERPTLLARHQVVDELIRGGVTECAAWKIAIRISYAQLDVLTIEKVKENIDQMIWDYLEFAGITFDDVAQKVGA